MLMPMASSIHQRSTPFSMMDIISEKLTLRNIYHTSSTVSASGMRYCRASLTTRFILPSGAVGAPLSLL